MTHAGKDARLLLGSSNPGKIEDWRAMLDHLALEIFDPVQLGLAVDAVESADTAEENARIKALAYFAASGIATFSLDAALRIEGLPAERQPGVHVRRIGGADSATDAEMVDHYSALLEKLGGRAAGEWTLGISPGARPAPRLLRTADEPDDVRRHAQPGAGSR